MKKEVKVGILTYHRAHNYGAVLQAFALKAFIESNVSVIIVDYWPEYHSKEYKMWDSRFKNKSFVGKAKYLVKYLITWRLTKKRFLAFEYFINKFLLNYPKDSRTFKTGEEIINNCNIYIYGSDQIWRSLDKGGVTFDNVYYGDYPFTTHEKKIAYAGSMGTILYNKEAKNNFIQKLSNFNEISIRDKSLKDFLETFSQREFTHVFDPIFLLDKETWVKRFGLLNDKQTAPYLLVYNLLENKQVTDLAEKIAEQKGLKVIEIVGTIRLFRDKNRFQQTAGPLEFLQLIYNSSFVVASSFHGVAFSILFNKEFCASSMGLKANRVLDMLEDLQLSDRYVSEYQINQVMKPINYNLVNILISKKRDLSRDFLKKAVFDEA
ncbi:polysaccharide pyruvyl transferase family protein [Sphingobacterium corticibacterium]|uniref:Polysaccharide pyruvyl transferase family protein n=1 Tax=Sphingobacterium corticibacterium TaxID=2484746 RepID=A0A4Q6XNR6_9SPHI|nr:polysaccharide pyruvyl transferase family protein [Sphingobacterium corticibacterium]RZF58944.1 polysaccharide pyruvyl transferase family protein [Sphingobacterium corticibacterium]